MYSTNSFKRFASISAVHELSRTLNADLIGALSKNCLRPNCAKSFNHNAVSFHSDNTPFLRPNVRSALTPDRYYCKGYRPFPEVSDFPPVLWPNLFKSIKTLLYSYFIIRLRFDRDFSLMEFAKTSRKAVAVVSNCIASRDYSTLQGLVTNDVFEQIKSIVSNLSDEEIKTMAFDEEDMYFFLPFNLDIIGDAKFKDKCFVEITMCYHAIHNLEEIKKRSEEIVDIQKELKSQIYVLNYRFIREYTEGVKDSWTVNAINHLKAEEHDKTIL